MNEDALLLLGILLTQSQHGYQINEFIEQNLSHIAEMKKATAYAILERLSKADYVSVHTEQEGNRPLRKVYTITETGEKKFFELLRDNLTKAYRMTFTGDIGIMLLDYLPPQEASNCLKIRLSQLDEQFKLVESTPKHEHGRGVNFTLEHLLLHLQVEKEWLHSAILRLEEKARETSEPEVNRLSGVVS